MRAVLCRRFGPPSELTVEDVLSPAPGDGQVRVAVRAAGVNFPDSLIIQGKYQFKPELPFSPGAEVAGTVLDVGPGVTGFKPGDRVIAATTWGGYAEEVVADARRALAMPDAMDFTTGAGFLLAYGTSHHALKDRGELRAGETLLVLGAAGGVGLAAVEIGKALGARVIAAASSDEKLAICREHGADEVVNYASEDLRERIKVLTAGRGIDVVYDPVGGDHSERALRSMAWGGRLLVVGFASGGIPTIPLNLVLLKGCAIVGVFWGTFTRNEPQRNAANLQQLLAWFSEGKLNPHVSATYPLERAADALLDVTERRVRGKIVLTTRP